MRTKLYKILVLIFFSGLLNIFLTSCKENNIQIKKITGKQEEINLNFQSDSAYIDIILPYKIKLQDEINTILCYNPRTLKREEGDLESSLGNLYADICFQKADSLFYKKTGKRIDFALFNYGGIRTEIPKGEISVKNIFELMPFENKLVVARLSADQVKSLFRYLEERKEPHPISHIKIKMNANKITGITINNQAYDSLKSYFILTHDYLQHGGDNMAFFKEPISLFNTEYKVRDAIIDHLSNLDTLHASLDGRFKITNQHE